MQRMAESGEQSDWPATNTPLRLAVRTLGVAVLYVASGLLALQTGLALQGPNGIATMVWPPAGIALAALLVCGRRVWPGIWFGCVILGAVMSPMESNQSKSVSSMAIVLMVVAIASGATLQALATHAFVRRFVPTALDTPRAVLTFLLGSAVTCFTHATIGSAALVLSGVRGSGSLAFGWTTWWVADTVGVFLVTPMLLAWVGKPVSVWRSRRLALTLSLLVALVLTATAFSQTTKLDGERANRDMEHLADHVGDQLHDALEDAMEGTESLRDLYHATYTIARDQFETVAARIRSRHGEISAMAWAPRVGADERQAFEHTTERGVGYRIWQRDASARAISAPARSEYFPMLFGEPPAQVDQLAGFDVASEPIRHAALEASRTRDTVTLSAPLQLFVRGRQRLGVLAVLPLREAGEQLRGFVLASLLVEPLMRLILQRQDIGAIGLGVEDPDAPVGQRILFASPGFHLPLTPETKSFDINLNAGGRTWRLIVAPVARPLTATHSWLSWAVLSMGLAFSALLSGFLLVTTGHSAHVQQNVARQTSALSLANANLLREVAEHEKVGLALKESEARWAFALEEAGDGTWDWYVVEGSLFWSPRLKALLGYAPDEIGTVISEWSSRVHVEDLPEAYAQIERHFKGESPFYEADLRMLCRDGSWKWIAVKAKVVSRDAAGQPLRMIGTQVDIDQRKHDDQELAAYRERLEEQVSKRTAELEIAKKAAEAANRAKSAFLANMSHELRTPMHAVLAYARLGIDRVQDAKLRDYLGRIIASGERLLCLLNDLLDLSKLEAGKLHLDIAPHDLEQLARAIGTELEPLSAAKRLSLQIDRDPSGLTCVAAVDVASMGQAFRNIVANAVRFSPDGGRLGVRFSPAELPDAEVGGGFRPALAIAFSDEGVGIPEAELDVIFDKFVQSSKTRTNAGGTGLGLAICRQIVEAHHGTIRARNNSARGATLLITLPLEIQKTEHEEAA